MAVREYFRIKAGKIINRVVADDQFVTSASPFYDAIVKCDETNSNFEIDDLYVAGAFGKRPLRVARGLCLFHKQAFREKFTFAELTRIDSGDVDPSLTAIQRAQMRSILKNFDVMDLVDIQGPDVIDMVDRVRDMGLLTTERAAEILAPPME